MNALRNVIPAKAGIQRFLKNLDARLRGHDERHLLQRRRPAAGEFAPVARLFNGYRA